MSPDIKLHTYMDISWEWSKGQIKGQSFQQMAL